jgi:hypothetical protein
VLSSSSSAVMVSVGVLVVVFPKEDDGFCSNANSFCACTPPILVASKRIKRNNSEDETTAKKNVIVRPFVVLREFVVIILSLLNNTRV